MIEYIYTSVLAALILELYRRIARLNDNVKRLEVTIAEINVNIKWIIESIEMIRKEKKDI